MRVHAKVRQRRAGFTLVEVLGAIAVIVLASIGLLTAYQSTLHLNEVAQQSSLALNDLKDMMERLKSTPFAQLQANFPNGTVNGTAGTPQEYTNIIGGYTLQNEQITVTHSPAVTSDPRELIVQVTWTNRGRTYQRSLSTIRSSEAS